MAYVKNIWVDQDVERPKTYEVTNNQDGSITLTDSFGIVTELGTPVNAINMNHLEDGLADTDCTKYNAATTYNTGEWVTGFIDNEKAIYVSLIDSNSGNPLSDDTKWEKVEMGGGSSRNIGEIVASTIPLTDAGLHLLDGALMQYGSYEAFIDYIADVYENTKTYNPNAFTIIGSPTITTDGIASGFTSSASVRTSSITFSSNVILEADFQLTSLPHYACIVGGTSTSTLSTKIAVTPYGELNLWLSSDGTNWDIARNIKSSANLISLNTLYNVKLVFNGSAYKLYYKTSNTAYVEAISVASDLILNSAVLQIGCEHSNTNFGMVQGSIDLKQFSITVDGEEVFNGTSIADFFCSESDWQTAVTTYGVCGKFVYNSTNNTVRLPKITGFIEGTTDVNALGDLLEAGLPNITGTFSAENTRKYVSGAFNYEEDTFARSTGSDSSSNPGFNMDASRSSSIYGNSNTVQPQSIKVLYYIVVATTTKTEIEVDIDEIATDLNGKADVDFINANNQAKILMASMGMPSNTYVDLTLGASGTTYTAPANGWVMVTQAFSNSCVLGIATVYTNRDGICSAQSYNKSGVLNVNIPVSKGETFKVYYDGTKTSNSSNRFQFIYAVGSESEAN